MNPQLYSSAEMNYWRRSSRVTGLDSVHNEVVRRTKNVTVSVPERIEKGILEHMGFFYRMMRKVAEEGTGMGTARERGRPQTHWIDVERKEMASRGLFSGRLSGSTRLKSITPYSMKHNEGVITTFPIIICDENELHRPLETSFWVPSIELHSCKKIINW